jgi:hypothetical protein
MIKELLATYKIVRDAERKQKELVRMRMVPLNYPIIKDLINSAYHDIVIEVSLVDGTKLTIKRDDPYKREQAERSAYF